MNARTAWTAIPLVLICFSLPAVAENACRWIPTFEKPAEEVAAMVEARSGRAPAVSCGAGSDYKVCHSCVDRLSEEQWNQIKPMLAEPQFRNWHSSWHISELDRERSFHRIIGEQTGRPAREVHGESFLYMHRELIRAVNANAAALGLPCMRGWSNLPERADDPLWPTLDAQNFLNDEPQCRSASAENRVNASRFVRSLSRMDNAVTQMVEQEMSAARRDVSDPMKLQAELDRIFRAGEARKAENRRRLLEELNLTEELVASLGNCSSAESLDLINRDHREVLALTRVEARPEYLTSNSLGILGNDVARNWHGRLHGIYDFSPPSNCARGDVRVECDNMGSFSTSHANLHFYQVHGLVDNYIDKWLKENGYEIAAKDCTGKAKCYQWKDTWSSTPPDFTQGTGCALGSSPEIPNPFPAPEIEPPPFIAR